MNKFYRAVMALFVCGTASASFGGDAPHNDAIQIAVARPEYGKGKEADAARAAEANIWWFNEKTSIAYTVFHRYPLKWYTEHLAEYVRIAKELTGQGVPHLYRRKHKLLYWWINEHWDIYGPLCDRIIERMRGGPNPQSVVDGAGGVAPEDLPVVAAASVMPSTRANAPVVIHHRISQEELNRPENQVLRTFDCQNCAARQLFLPGAPLRAAIPFARAASKITGVPLERRTIKLGLPAIYRWLTVNASEIQARLTEIRAYLAQQEQARQQEVASLGDFLVEDAASWAH